MTDTELFQRVMGKLSWEDYMRLKKYSKRINENIEDIVAEAILKYLDLQEKVFE